VRRGELDQLARWVVEAQVAPAVVCAAGFYAKGRWCWGSGAAGTLWPNSSAAVGPDTIFDLASLTKPLVAVAAATESVRGVLNWTELLGAILPELRGTHAASATIENLLSHRAGLVPHLELFERQRAGHQYSRMQLLRNAATAVRCAQRASHAEPDSARRAVGCTIDSTRAPATIERVERDPPDIHLLRASTLSVDPRSPRVLSNSVPQQNEVSAQCRIATVLDDSLPPPIYSDLGYLLAGAAVERRVGKPLDHWLNRILPALTKGRIGSARQWREWNKSFGQNCAPTEVVPWRGGLVNARVHDENAWVIGGFGLCGHAGLFATAMGVGYFGAHVVDALAGRASAIPRNAARLVTSRRPKGTQCAGFDRKSEVGSSAGQLASMEAFGHLGFTGTSIWCDPVDGVVVVLLTNRICPSRDNLRIRKVRPDIHDELHQWARTQMAVQTT
jgi:CubicO group peptidase (beta-lactamase class C family)